MRLDTLAFNERLKDIKLIVCDVDGTLTNDNDEVGETTKEYLQRLKKLGVIFTLSTQKILSAVCHIIDELNIEAPFITANGKLISDCKGNILIENYLKPKSIKRALGLAKFYNVKIGFCNNNEIIYTEENSVISKLHHRIGTNYRLVSSYDGNLNNIVEIIIVGYDRKVIRHLNNKIRFPFGLFVKSKYFRLSSGSGMYNIEIRRSGINKKSSLKKLAKHLNVSKHRVAVIGDWYNDMELFKYGGLNIALQNAVPRLRFLADYIVPKTNNEDGVGDFLKMLYEIKSGKR